MQKLLKLATLVATIATVTSSGVAAVQLIPIIGHQHVMAYDTSTGHVTVYEGMPAVGKVRTHYQWKSIKEGPSGHHALLSVTADIVLDWVPSTGEVTGWSYNPEAKGRTDPLPGKPLFKHQWKSIRTGRQLIALDQGMVMDWEPESGDVRIWQFVTPDCSSSDPFPGAPLAHFNWKSIRAGSTLIYAGDDKVYEDRGTSYRLWRLDRIARGKADPLPELIEEGVKTPG